MQCLNMFIVENNKNILCHRKVDTTTLRPNSFHILKSVVNIFANHGLIAQIHSMLWHVAFYKHCQTSLTCLLVSRSVRQTVGALRVHGGGDPAAAALRAAGGRLQPPHGHRRHRPRRHQQGRQQRGLVHHVGPVHRGIYLDNIKKAVYYLLSSLSSLRC